MQKLLIGISGFVGFIFVFLVIVLSCSPSIATMEGEAIYDFRCHHTKHAKIISINTQVLRYWPNAKCDITISYILNSELDKNNPPIRQVKCTKFSPTIPESCNIIYRILFVPPFGRTS